MANIKTIASEWKSGDTNKEDKEAKNRSAEEVVAELKDIERKYASNDYVDAPDSLGLDKVEVPNKTDDQLKEAAEQSLKEKYDKKKQSTDQGFRKQIESLLETQEKNKEDNLKQQEQINKNYDDSIKATESQALRRGLARSSIVISQLSALEGGRANDLSQSLKDLEDKLTSAENQIASLEKEQQEALDSLDIEYAMELDEQIEKAREEYQKSVKEAIEFNNNVDKLEAEYKMKLDKQKQDKQETLTELQAKYGSSYTYKKIKDEQFDYLKDYLQSLDKDYALELLLTNNDFKRILSSRYSEMYNLISKG